MNGFEVYKVYLAIKLHFTSKNQSYDFHKHGGRTTARLETFTKRRDRYFFHKLSKSYNDITIVDYFVSNFVTNTNHGLVTSSVTLATKLIKNGLRD